MPDSTFNPDATPPCPGCGGDFSVDCGADEEGRSVWVADCPACRWLWEPEAPPTWRELAKTNYAVAALIGEVEAAEARVAELEAAEARVAELEAALFGEVEANKWHAVADEDRADRADQERYEREALLLARIAELELRARVAVLEQERDEFRAAAGPRLWWVRDPDEEGALCYAAATPGEARAMGAKAFGCAGDDEESREYREDLTVSLVTEAQVSAMQDEIARLRREVAGG